MNNKHLSLIFSDVCLIYIQVKMSMSISIFPHYTMCMFYCIILFNTLCLLPSTENGYVRYGYSVQFAFHIQRTMIGSGSKKPKVSLTNQQPVPNNDHERNQNFVLHSGGVDGVSCVSGTFSGIFLLPPDSDAPPPTAFLISPVPLSA